MSSSVFMAFVKSLAVIGVGFAVIFQMHKHLDFTYNRVNQRFKNEKIHGKPLLDRQISDD